MSKAKCLRAGLTAAAALLMLSACASRNDVAALDNRVSALESRANTAEAKVAAGSGGRQPVHHDLPGRSGKGRADVADVSAEPAQVAEDAGAARWRVPGLIRCDGVNRRPSRPRSAPTRASPGSLRLEARPAEYLDRAVPLRQVGQAGGTGGLIPLVASHRGSNDLKNPANFGGSPYPACRSGGSHARA